MRNLLFVVLLCVVASCSKKNENEVIVNVKVDNMTYDKVILTFNATAKQVDLDAKGHVTITAKVPDYTYARFYYGDGNKNLFLEKGEEINISFDAGKFNDDFQFDGKNAPIVDFLNTVNYSQEGLDNYGLSMDEYIKVMETRIGDALELLKARKLEAVNPKFVQLEKERIKYIFAANLLMYPIGHPFISQDTAYVPGDDFYEVLQKNIVENEELVNIQEYREYIREAIVYLEKRGGKSVSGFYGKLLCDVKYLGEHFTNEKVKQSLIMIYAVEYISTFGNKNIEELNALCNQYITDPELKAEYQTVYENK